MIQYHTQNIFIIISYHVIVFYLTISYYIIDNIQYNIISKDKISYNMITYDIFWIILNDKYDTISYITPYIPYDTISYPNIQKRSTFYDIVLLCMAYNQELERKSTSLYVVKTVTNSGPIDQFNCYLQ